MDYLLFRLRLRSSWRQRYVLYLLTAAANVIVAIPAFQYLQGSSSVPHFLEIMSGLFAIIFFFSPALFFRDRKERREQTQLQRIIDQLPLPGKEELTWLLTASTSIMLAAHYANATIGFMVIITYIVAAVVFAAYVINIKPKSKIDASTVQKS